jgi:hypothetical protein
MGRTSVALLLLLSEERGLVEIGALQPSLGFKDFRHAARLHSLTNGQLGGEKQTGLQPPPRPQLQGSSSSGLRQRSAPSVGAASAWVGDPFLPPAFEGEGHPPAPRRRPPAMRGKANCCSLARVQLSVLHPGDGRAARGPATSRSSSAYAARAVLVFWDGLGEDGSEDLSVRFGAAVVHQRGVGGPPLVRLPTVAIASADETVGASCAPDLRLFGFNAWFSSPVRGHERRPFSSSVCPEVIAAAILAPEVEVVVALLAQWSPTSCSGLVIPQALWCGGSSFPREWS